MGAYVLGLDLGPSSIGWAAIEADKQGNPKGFVQLQDGEKSYPAICYVSSVMTDMEKQCFFVSQPFVF